MEDRRSFFCSVAFVLCAAARAADAQTTGRIVRVGVLSSAAMPLPSDTSNAVWPRSLRELGWIEGQNIVIERRYAGGRNELLAAYAQDLVQARVDVITTFSSSDAMVAKRATSVIPIVMVFSGLDPVEEGFVASFARPGGNITGVSRMLAETRAKRLELIKAMLPSASRIAVLAPPQPDSGRQTAFERSLRTAAHAAQVDLQFFQYRNPEELLDALPYIVGARMHAFMLEPTFQAFENRGRIANLALKLQMPAVFTLGEYATAGGLLSYGPDWSSILKQQARFVDRILRGANPGDLPMEQPTKFELVINLKTAKALGITIPQALLLRADEVIQ